MSGFFSERGVARVLAWVPLIWLGAVFLRLCRVLPLPWAWVLGWPLAGLLVCLVGLGAAAWLLWGWYAVRAWRAERRDRRKRAILQRLMRESRLANLQPGSHLAIHLPARRDLGRTPYQDRKLPD